jgi:hypothetical protein
MHVCIPANYRMVVSAASVNAPETDRQERDYATYMPTVGSIASMNRDLHVHVCMHMHVCVHVCVCVCLSVYMSEFQQTSCGLKMVSAAALTHQRQTDREKERERVSE